MRRFVRAVAVVATSLALGAAPSLAHAFCGFYVSGATGELYNNATLVVLMREGTRTVLSMANNYQGPPENFAMVVPVPVVLQKENVKTLPRDLFKKVDQLAAPRLVEYWEQDPCFIEKEEEERKEVTKTMKPTDDAKKKDKGLGVTVEAQFTVGEYEVVVLSAKDSSGLDTWLRQQKYNIPANAEPVLKPYVTAGMKFFVAKVDLSKVQKEGDKTMLSPLRFHYDSDKFELPVRLGLLNSSGKQDLLVHILARGKRYEVANYPNVTIPTNLDVGEITKEQFAPFYAALFDQTVEKHPKAVVTEYSWDAGSCDPCPGPTLGAGDLMTLGADALETAGKADKAADAKKSKGKGRGWGGGFVLTRLHARYGKDTLGEDLVFKEAPAITGGREVRMDGKKLEQGSTAGSINNFQGRYAIRHPWKGPISCPNPRFGMWGGPPGGDEVPRPASVKDVAFAPRGTTALPMFLAQDVPEIGVQGKAAPVSPVLGAPGVAPSAPEPAASAPEPYPSAKPSSGTVPEAPPKGGCAGCATPSPDAGPLAALLSLLGVGAAAWRRKRAPS